MTGHTIEHVNMKALYFIGIGGIGMSAAAGIARSLGVTVGGSDAKDVYDPSKHVLDEHGIEYSVGYARENFEKFCAAHGKPDLAVVTAALDQTNPEIAYALEQGIAVASYPQVLGELLGGYQRVVVAGTHGKGTTSGLISYVLKEVEDDSFFVGGVLNDLSTNFSMGKGSRIVLEGDEYISSAFDRQPKFMYYRPDTLLINNLEFDHPDVYPTLEDVKAAFGKLVATLPSTGTLVYNADDANASSVAAGFSGKKIAFGFEAGAAFLGGKLRVEHGVFYLPVSYEGRSFEIASQLPGSLYAYDNLAAAAVLVSLGISPEKFLPYFAEYRGIERRYQIVSDGDITVIDDYAHHATAVAATLAATRQKYPGRRVLCVFEPHTYSRTRETIDLLATAFRNADVTYIAEVYPAREQKLPTSITGHDVIARILEANPATEPSRIRYVADRSDAIAQLKQEMKPGDVVIVMAVGSFNTLVHDIG